jgi:hypothetical protein
MRPIIIIGAVLLAVATAPLSAQVAPNARIQRVLAGLRPRVAIKGSSAEPYVVGALRAIRKMGSFAGLSAGWIRSWSSDAPTRRGAPPSDRRWLHVAQARGTRR